VRRHASLGAVVISAVVAVLLPGIAQGYDECRGLRSCLSVVGPWVAVAPRADGGLIPVGWEMRCPLAGHIVRGPHARGAGRALRVTSRVRTGRRGSPRVATRPAGAGTSEVEDLAPWGGGFCAGGHLRTLARVLGVDVTPLLAPSAEPYADAPIDPRRVFGAEHATGRHGPIGGVNGGARFHSSTAAGILPLRPHS